MSWNVPRSCPPRWKAERLGVRPEYLETGELIPEVVDREIRLSDAELELR
jgi:hypothetical protein